VSRRPSNRSLVVIWRDAVRDSRLKSTTKLVAFVHSTFMDAYGMHSYGADALARGASLVERSIHTANEELRGEGWLFWERHPGGRRVSNRYVVTLPETVNELHRAEWERVQHVQGLADGKGASHDTKGASDDVKGAPRADDLEERSSRDGQRRAKGGARRPPTNHERLDRWIENTGHQFAEADARALLEDSPFNLEGADLEHALDRLAHARVDAGGAT
jgi:hypothetical protein